MRTARTFILGGMLAVIATLGPWARATETDQFTVPPKPLKDLGPDVDRELGLVLERVASEANDQLRQAIDDALATSWGWKRNGHLADAAECLTDRYIARKVYEALGKDDGRKLLVALARAHKSDLEDYVFEPPLGKTIYGGSPFTWGLAIVKPDPTLNVHGIYFGGDKVGHLFQQGYEYYEIYADARESGASETGAVAKAVDKGIGQEKGIYGEAIDGIYSNADLAANYAGFEFYRNLTRPVTVGQATLPPIFIIKDAHWQLNSSAGQSFMKHFITEHLSESFNPSRYLWTLRGSIKDNIRERGAAYVEFYKTTREREAKRMQDLTTWFGAPYGHRESECTIINSYFDSK